MCSSSTCSCMGYIYTVALDIPEGFVQYHHTLHATVYILCSFLYTLKAEMIVEMKIVSEFV